MAKESITSQNMPRKFGINNYRIIFTDKQSAHSMQSKRLS